jgi:hypothetical protein
LRTELGVNAAVTGHVDASCSVESKERHLVGHGQVVRIAATSLLVSWCEHTRPAGAQCVQYTDRPAAQNDTPSGGVSGYGCGRDGAKTGCTGHFLKKKAIRECQRSNVRKVMFVGRLRGLAFSFVKI